MECLLEPHATQESSPTCRMIRWFRAQHDAERELERLLGNGWMGSLHDCIGIWQVDVVRPLRVTG
ncbi:MAG: hypothetical protein HUU46_05445 [Candidatus Hydrogenedentes bacterium]|nr:hypothetical protein [Candidatus Hydrogenedentota bacterium]